MAFCTGIAKSVRKILHAVTPEIEKYVEYALTLTGVVRDALQSNTATEITKLIPGTWDDNLRSKVIEAANQAGLELALFDKEMQTEGDVIAALHNHVKTLPEKMQNGTLIKFASRVLAWLDGTKQQESTYDTIAQAASLK